MNMIKAVFLAVLLSCTCSCGTAGTSGTISDLAYNRTHSAEPIYIKEDGQYVPFLVLSDDYYGNTLLMRKDVLEKQMRLSEYSSYYKDNEVDRFLNEEYIKLLTETEPYIVSSDIVITGDSALGLSAADTETISRKIFLLSCSELGIDDSVNMAQEGEELDYFQNAENRIAYRNGEPASWWLRTPDTYFLSCTYVVGDNNKIGYTNAYDENGIRPAFCVDGNLKIELKGGIADNRQVYVFSE